MKYVIAYETLCTGLECMKNEDETPMLYNTYEEAFEEIFDGNLSMLKGQTVEEINDLGVSEETLKLMEEVYLTDDIDKMLMFMLEHQECNYTSEYVMSEDEFVSGKKTIFTAE